MKRGLERKLLIVGSIWNMFTALITIVGYSTWFKKTGIEGIQDNTVDSVVAGMTLVDNVTKVILTFGLFIFVGAIVNFLIARNIKDDEIQYKTLIWIACWALLQLVVMDIVGFVLFLIVFVIYTAKNKAIKLSQVHPESI
ncbi:hypothetical protein [Lederbergia lenta]|uniref:DUF4064 domain-containing protein n=1 Tax=Lederbergia lenta TaxID=1467 RepID=A0A2X4WUP1_LEDLE|nr:hypothetical protein [Lederbergia lenta]MCM3111853.1 hypothetical protein [Lederbergia lenta]MEC2323007.1 hypothetical protein [Lederbergia lenta]SQI62192.1 Uncharacterised protein [Lederbergia lenta]